VKAYEYRPGVTEEGPFLHRSEDPVWPPPQRAYGGPEEPDTKRQLIVLGLASLRLAVPVSLLLVLLGAAYLYIDALLPMGGMPAPIRDAGLAVSDLVLPGAWTCIHLTNRRYGPAYAFAQLLAALVIAVLVVLINPGSIDEWVTNAPALTVRALLSFGGAFLVANFVAITFFGAARGPRWWTAPLTASFAASFVFSAIYYPAAFAGIDERWTDSALAHFAVFFGMSALLLMPYWLLRPAMRPLNGRNGY
jgi:uncharacterized PurR-regulated membrane protein YhhQ (DUF165 family)